MIESLCKARMKGGIDRLINQGVAWFEDEVRQEHVLGGNKGDPTAHSASLDTMEEKKQTKNDGWLTQQQHK